MFDIAPAGSTFDAEKKFARRIDKHIVLDTCVLHREFLGYVFAVLALVSAFAADKLLRGTFDSVLKRLEQEAEETKDAGKGTK